MEMIVNVDEILVVDDDQNWHSAIGRVLRDQYDVRFAVDEAQSLELAQSIPFALAILDQRLGPTTGIELLDRLRAIQREMPAIILTGYPDHKDAERGIEKGVIGYFSKGDRELATVLRDRITSALANYNPIAALVRKGESETLEFKSSARWDVNLQRVNKDVEAAIVKTVAGFLNSHQGGDLLIGVGDGGESLGLQRDYESLGRHQNRDGFQSFLVKLLSDAYGKDVSAFLRIAFHQLDGSDVCRVTARPAAHEVYVDDDKFFLRIGNTTARLNTREATDYCRVRWPHPGSAPPDPPE
jgi:ActR/RegA family two-component response regulator